MKIGIVCMICEFFTVVGILYALVCGAQLQEILAGVLLMLLFSLVFIQVKGWRSK